MFTFDAMPVKFVGLLVMFAWCTVWSVYELTRPQAARQRVGNVLHLAMSVVMLLMVAGWTWHALTSVVPTWLLAVLFGGATGWFVLAAIDGFRTAGRHGGMHFAGHATMFAAMTWHLAAMAVKHDIKAEASGHLGGMGDMGGMDHGSAGLDEVSATDVMMQASGVGGALWILALIGLPLMAYLVVASVGALSRVVNGARVEHAPAMAHVGAAGAPAEPVASCHEERPAGSVKDRLGALSDFSMNFGMFWMSTGLLTPIVPLFALLSF